MTDGESTTSEGNAGSASATPKKRRASGRKPAARKPSGRRPAARRKATARRKAAAPISFEAVIRGITGGVAVARAAIAEASGQGANAFMRAVDTASTASRKTVTRLAREWRSMDPKKKARILAALLGAAAAASAPLVRKRFKK